MRKVIFEFIVILSFALILSSCSKKSNTNPVNNTTADITGHWVGQQNYNGLLTAKLDLNLVDTQGIITGNGIASYTPIAGNGRTDTLSAIGGTFYNPDVTLTNILVTYNGKLSSDQKTISGTAGIPNIISGTGTMSLNMTLVKQ